MTAGCPACQLLQGLTRPRFQPEFPQRSQQGGQVATDLIPWPRVAAQQQQRQAQGQGHGRQDEPTQGFAAIAQQPGDQVILARSIKAEPPAAPRHVQAPPLALQPGQATHGWQSPSGRHRARAAGVVAGPAARVHLQPALTRQPHFTPGVGLALAQLQIAGATDRLHPGAPQVAAHHPAGHPGCPHQCTEGTGVVTTEARPSFEEKRIQAIPGRQGSGRGCVAEVLGLKPGLGGMDTGSRIGQGCPAASQGQQAGIAVSRQAEINAAWRLGLPAQRPGLLQEPVAAAFQGRSQQPQFAHRLGLLRGIEGQCRPVPGHGGESAWFHQPHLIGLAGFRDSSAEGSRRGSGAALRIRFALPAAAVEMGMHKHPPVALLRRRWAVRAEGHPGGRCVVVDQGGN